MKQGGCKAQGGWTRECVQEQRETEWSMRRGGGDTRRLRSRYHERATRGDFIAKRRSRGC